MLRVPILCVAARSPTLVAATSSRAVARLPQLAAPSNRRCRLTASAAGTAPFPSARTFARAAWPTHARYLAATAAAAAAGGNTAQAASQELDHAASAGHVSPGAAERDAGTAPSPAELPTPPAELKGSGPAEPALQAVSEAGAELPDWRVGAALAGASFEAYCELKERGLPERLAGGAEIFYLDREFVQAKLAGLLQVTVHQADSAPAAKASSPLFTGPQLSLSVGASTWGSGTVLNNTSTEREESCTLFVRDQAQQALQVQVQGPAASATASARCTLGCAELDLRPLCDGQTHELSVELMCSAAEDGSDGDSSGGEDGGSGAGGSNSSSGQEAQGAVESTDGSPPGPDGGHSGGGTELHPCGSVRLSCRFFSFKDEQAKEAAADAEMGPPVVATPGQIPLAKEWRELIELAGVAAHAMFKPVAYVENAVTNTQAWLYWNCEQRTACVAFRGTEQGKWRDILTDLHVVPAPLHPDRVASAPIHAALAEVSQPPEEPSQLSSILTTIEEAKQKVEAERQLQQEAQGSEEQAQEHILSTAVSAVRSTAEDLQAVFSRVQEEISAAEEAEGAAGKEAQPWVHSGFLTAWDSVRPAVLTLLCTLLEGEGGQGGGQQAQRQDEAGQGDGAASAEPWRVYMTGHSLGGALATLCAWDCAHRSWPVPVEIENWNLGCPRVGNRVFADSYNQLVPSTWRVVNARDTVCTIPRLMGFAHVGHAIYLQEDGSVDVVRHSTERLGEGISLPDVAPAVGAAMVAKFPELLPDAATEALKLVGFEVAASGQAEATGDDAMGDVASSADSEARRVVDECGEAVQPPSGLGEGGGSGGGGAAAPLSPGQLADFLEEEREAWAMLLDGGALDQHMEPLYLANLKALLTSMKGEVPRAG